MLTMVGNTLAYLLTGWFVLCFSLIVGTGLYFASVVVYFMLF
jgi:hypothetical protein